MRYYLTSVYYFFKEHPGYIGIGLIVIISLFLCYLIFKYVKVRRAARKAAKTQAGPAAQVPPAEETASKNLLVLANRIRIAFKQALKLLKAYFPERRFRYRLPWFLMIGEAGSGKSSLLRHAGLKLPLGPPEEEEWGTNSPCKFWFFDQGLVLDLDGSLIFRPDGEEAKDRAWKFFVKTLYKSRPERALDGVILTIPIQDLLDFKNADRSLHEKRAQQYYKKLRDIQITTGISFPVYLLVTQTDRLPGFSEFCAELPESLQNNIFGWSVPHELSLGYSSNWVNEAFDDIRSRIGQLQLEVAYKGFNARARDGFFLFPERLDTLRPALQIYMDEIFTTTTFHDPIFMRGVYFTGEVTMPEPDEDDAELLWAGPERLLPHDDVVVDPFAPFESPRENEPVVESSGPARPSFIRDLLAVKIFPERQVARPTRHKLKTQNKAVWWARAITITVTVLFFVGVLYTYNSFGDKRYEMEPAMRGIKKALIDKEALEASGQHFDPHWFSNPKNPLFTGMNNLESHRFISVFFPTSIISGVNDRIAEAVTVGYEKILLDSLGDQLKAKMEDLATKHTPTTPLNEDSPVIEDYQLLESFNAFQQYFEDLEQMTHFIGVYNDLKETRDPSSVQELVRYCFNFEIPDGTLRRLVDFDIDFTKFETIEFKQHQSATDKADKLFTQFLNDMFNPADVLIKDQEDLRSLLENKTGWMDEKYPDLAELKRMSLELTNTKRFFQNDHLGLFNNSEVVLKQHLLELFDKIDHSHHINDGLEDKYEALMRKRYADSKDQLDVLFLEEVINFRLPILAFFSQTYLNDKTAELKAAPRENYNRWAQLDLTNAIKYYNSFQVFKRDHLDTKQQGGWSGMLKQLSITYLERNINALLDKEPAGMSAGIPIATKPTTQELELPGTETEEDMLADAEELTDQNLGFIIDGFFQAYTHLAKIEDIFLDLGLATSKKNLTTNINNKASFLLFTVDSMLEEGIYVTDFNLDGWDGKTNVSPKGLGFEDGNQLQLYLDQNRHRIWHLGKDYADPLISILNRSLNDPKIASLKPLQEWTGILEEIHAYDEKKPYPAMRQLEVFFTSEINQITLLNYKKTAKVGEASSNFFINKIHRVKQLLYKHCADMELRRHLESYRGLQTVFRSRVLDIYNDQLANHYPFAPAYVNKDLEPVQLGRFIDNFREAAEPLRQAVLYEKKPSEEAKEALSYMSEMEAGIQFLEPFADGRAHIDFQTRLRANRKNERKGNQILAWKLTVGDKEFGIQDKVDTGTWNMGDTITLSLRWAKDSPTQPRAIEGDPFYNVEGTVATFTYRGPWAMFRFMALHRPPQTATRGKTSELIFEIPLQRYPAADQTDLEPTEAAVVFVQFQPTKDGKPVTMDIPKTPLKAPEIFGDLLEPTQPDNKSTHTQVQEGL